MSVKTKKINDHMSRIFVDSKATPFVVEKGDDPKWGEHRNWYIYEWIDGGFEGVVMTVHRRKSDALSAFEGIWRAAQKAALP
jgi:hypothetical protein